MKQGSENEMEQIQKGLEQFLDHEIKEMAGAGNDGRREGRAAETEDVSWEERATETEDVFWEERAAETEDASWEEYTAGEEYAAREGRIAGEGYVARRRTAGEARAARQGHIAGEEDASWEEYTAGEEHAAREEHITGEEYAARRRTAGEERAARKGRTVGERHTAREEYTDEEGYTTGNEHTTGNGRTVRQRRTAGASDAEWEEPSGKGTGKERKSMKKQNKKKKSKWKKLLAVLVILAALFFCGLYFAVGVVYDKMNYQESESLAGKPLKKNGVVSVLLIGSDSRTADNEGRSDAMILLTISNKTKTIRMTSLLRDMYVDIPGHDGNRLNAAYAYGGPELLLETVNENFGLEVSRYAVVNFEAFANLVDAVEGVDMELTNDEVQWVNAYLNEYNLLRNMPIDTDYLDTSLSGTIHLNGAQALAYSRNRYIGTDFGRTERQRKVLAAVIKRLPLAAVKNPRELVNGLFPNLTTNLTQMECTQLALLAGKAVTYDIVQDSIPLDGTYSNASIRGMAVLQVDFDKNKEYLQKEIYGKE